MNRVLLRAGIDLDDIEDRPSIDRPEPLTPKEIAAQYWWELHDRGVSIRQIAAMVDLPKSTVGDGIRAAERRRLLGPPRVTPILDSAGYRPRQPCGHRGAIRKGSRFYCPECHDLGTRAHPGLKIAPNDPLLKQRKKAAAKGAKRTRKERRRQGRI